jgi:hypothetical protein
LPRYFFHVIDGKFLVDTEGTQCASLGDMRHQAIRTAGDILSDMAGHFPAGLDWQMHVTDENQATVLKLHFSAEEPVHMPPPTVARHD